MTGYTKSLKRLVVMSLLAGGLIVSSGNAGAGSEREALYGPCRFEDAAFLKCVHYKLQEARRLGPSRQGGCSHITSLIDDTGYFYWACKAEPAR